MQKHLQIYEQLWNTASSVFERGEPQIDPHLSDKAHDFRRGVTIVLRPSAEVQGAVGNFLERLRRLCPQQYFYRPEELHVTVLSIISAKRLWRKEIRHLAAYRTIINEALRCQSPFKIEFRGVTASPGAVLIQGIPLCDRLDRIRAELRNTFTREGFGSTLDRRYRIEAAHLTAMRVCNPESDWKGLAAIINECRRLNFGVTEVDRLELIWGDWYASAKIVRTLREYRLSV